MDNSIEIENLTKIYGGNIKAVDNVTLKIGRGQVYGLLGQNGAGKTTLIKMLTGILKPTSGTAKIAGFDLNKDALKIRQITGVVPQDFTTDADLSGYENLKLVADLYGVPKKEAEERIETLLNMVDLYDVKNRRVSAYSGGMRKRLELICGLINTPEVLFLDEPTLGLDVTTRSNLWKYIKSIRDEFKITIILTSHYLDEVDALSDRLSIMDHGKIIVSGTSDELKKSLKGDIITLRVKNDSEEKIVENFKDAIEVKKMEMGDIRMKVNNSDVVLPELMKYLASNNISPESISIRKPSLDEVFIEYTGKHIDSEQKDYAKMMGFKQR
ncbi:MULTISPECIES: ATP-binding cassette domain-containing protein [Acidiplasma]|jgi:ABC-2 type transport system ATP-binding protein|uniref:ABC transporter ATP-binding protein n=4 Tax=Acidiplasma TaxID=507753 RepID=A0A0N8VLB8_9ARCH|nr:MULTISPECIES: ATP-binding cassette domain-containing protein [Acidiplasma]KJE49100.1 ABC transporter ATP-binding protein [Acidiplasma sp. MBA-1]KPV47024.1 ABC transporter ATP-binding protein [Acidiplasma aeolicum]KQB34642.1 ABC transporter ATP-binding protein [Acidiplasma aeolicum]KQB36084.1 ABC transporter ATP-binding protein [Acidiplasma cupricumulans]WMT54448.1 MAG: ATP-binding cassette domain-containing protein [Acidiplasma sp.]